MKFKVRVSVLEKFVVIAFQDDDVGEKVLFLPADRTVIDILKTQLVAASDLLDANYCGKRLQP